MRKFLADVPYFLEAAKAASFTQAADTLGIPLATLSRRIAALEQALGTKLFFRTSRTIRLTEDGKELLESGKFILAEATGVRQRLKLKQLEPVGPIRLSMEAFVYHCFLHGAFGTFLRKYPKIDLHTVFSTEWKDLHRDPYDLDIRSGPVPYSEFKVRRVLSIDPVLYCAPELLKTCSEPKTPQDISRMPIIFQVLESRYTLTFSKGGEAANVVVKPKHTVQSMGLALELALSGQGATTFMPPIASRFEESGQLVRLLPDWKMAGVDVHIAMPNGQIPKRVRLLVEHLIEHFNSIP